MTMPIPRCFLAVLFVGLAATSSRPAAAQAPGDSVPSPVINARVAQPADSTRLSTLATMGVRRVWDMPAGGATAKRHTVRGAVIGGVAGAILGALAGGVIRGGFCDAAECGDVTRDGILAGGALGAVAGAGIGALIGYKW
jgi:hypothetical protein